MTRLLDVESALTARGYPEGVAGEVSVEVDDQLFEDNRGPFRITVEGGSAKVERIDGEPNPVRLSIRGLSGLYAGYFSPADLASAGALDASHPSASMLGSFFAGSPPFMIDHF